MSPTPRLSRPTDREHPPGYGIYFASIAGDDAAPELWGQVNAATSRLAVLSDTEAMHRYAPGKWSVKQVIGHLADNERVFAYRALRFARGDPTPLADYDENRYAETGRFDARSLGSILEEWRTVRAASLSLYETFDEAALARRGIARGVEVSVRALVWVTAAHARHHLNVLRDRYGIG